MSQVRAGLGTSVAAVAELGHEPPALIMVYASVRYDLPSLLAAIGQATGGAPVVGATTSGHFHNGGITPPGRGVAVLALSEGRYRFGTGVATGLRGDAFGAGQALAGRDADVLLAFSCVARYELLRDRATEEAQRLHAAAGGAQTFGFYTYGEFARTTSVSGFHNATITAMAL